MAVFSAFFGFLPVMPYLSVVIQAILVPPLEVNHVFKAELSPCWTGFPGEESLNRRATKLRREANCSHQNLLLSAYLEVEE